MSCVVGLTISSSEAMQVRTTVNPIRRVVNLLQEMVKCRGGSLKKRCSNVSNASGKRQEQICKKTGTNIEAAQGSVVQLKSELAQSQHAKCQSPSEPHDEDLATKSIPSLLPSP